MKMEIISFLPQEIMTDIFSRIPPKSVGRCRCVSKSWRTFLSQRRFAKTKFLQQSLILVSDTGPLFTVPFFNGINETARKLSFVSHTGPWDNILAACDGLVLLEDSAVNLFLVNPVTREIRQIPALPFGLNIKDCFNKYGVGYDSVNDDYKTVVLSYYRPCLAPSSDDDGDEDNGIDIYDKVFVSVFSTKKGIWNEVERSPYYHGHDDSPIPGVFVNGYIHWIAHDARGYLIAAFDVVTERFSIVPSPNSCRVSSESDLVEFGGDLCLYEGTDYWIMKEYGNTDSWIQVKLNGKEGTHFRPLCMLSERQIVLVQDEEYEPAKFVKYDLDKQILRDIVIDGDPDDFEVQGTFIATSEESEGPRFCRGAFIESLVSPHWSPTTS